MGVKDCFTEEVRLGPLNFVELLTYVFNFLFIIFLLNISSIQAASLLLVITMADCLYSNLVT